MAFHYVVYGLRIRSALPLPELAQRAAPGEAPHVDIRLGSVGRIASPRLEERNAIAADDDCILIAGDIARYRVRGGTEIIVERGPDAADSTVRAFLLGSALGALCQQRRLLPLHASAIEVDGRVVAFAGASGAGKSTLAAYFHDRGYRIVSDDVCVVDTVRGHGQVAPGEPRLKLCRDAAEMLGRPVATAAAECVGSHKLQFPARRTGAELLPFDRLYVLDEAGAQRPPEIRRIAGAQVMDALFHQTYRQFLLSPMGLASAHFVQCTALSRHARLYTVRRRRGWEHFEAQAHALERHFTVAEPASLRQAAHASG